MPYQTVEEALRATWARGLPPRDSIPLARALDHPPLRAPFRALVADLERRLEELDEAVHLDMGSAATAAFSAAATALDALVARERARLCAAVAEAVPPPAADQRTTVAHLAAAYPNQKLRIVVDGVRAAWAAPECLPFEDAVALLVASAAVRVERDKNAPTTATFAAFVAGSAASIEIPWNLVYAVSVVGAAEGRIFSDAAPLRVLSHIVDGVDAEGGAPAPETPA